MYQRWSALDRLRGIALVGMVIHHLTEWMAGTPGPDTGMAVLRSSRTWPRWPSSWPPGASLALFVSSRRPRGCPGDGSRPQVLRRYGLLVPIGLALDWVFWRHPAMFGVLEALGVAGRGGCGRSGRHPGSLLPRGRRRRRGRRHGGRAPGRRPGGWWADECWPGSSPPSPTWASCWWAWPPCAPAATRTGAGPDGRPCRRGRHRGAAGRRRRPRPLPGRPRLRDPRPGGHGHRVRPGPDPCLGLAAIDGVVRRAAAHTLGHLRGPLLDLRRPPAAGAGRPCPGGGRAGGGGDRRGAVPGGTPRSPASLPGQLGPGVAAGPDPDRAAAGRPAGGAVERGDQPGGRSSAATRSSRPA